MKKGLLLGKFMPFHKGHIGLIDFALANTDALTILVCAHSNEPIDANTRYRWIDQYYHNNRKIEVHLIIYDETELSSSSDTSAEASFKWAHYLKNRFAGINIFISSEAYGEQVAACWGIDFLCFDQDRRQWPVSATLIRNNPFASWNWMPPLVQSYYVKKICIAGSESTGKSTLTKKLATHYQTVFVPEIARDIIPQSANCTVEDLYTVAAAHASAIIEAIPLANKLLFVDTGISITKSYGHFLFNTEIVTADWIAEANGFDLYLFLETDCPFVQDGTRLDEEARKRLGTFHKAAFAKEGIAYNSVSGNWEERFAAAVDIIQKTFFELPV